MLSRVEKLAKGAIIPLLKAWETALVLEVLSLLEDSVPGCTKSAGVS